MEKHKILTQAYEKLGLTFLQVNDKHLYIEHFHQLFFRYQLNITNNSTEILTRLYDSSFVEHNDGYLINKGTQSFQCYNIYEMLLWYYYYTIKHKHIKHKNMNQSYFSRIPSYYKNIDPKRGLNIIKEMLDKLILKHNGIPKYYNEKVLQQIIKIK
jgi:hypothetical protein